MPSKKPSWSLFAGKSAAAAGGTADAATKSGSKRKETADVSVEAKKKSKKAAAATDAVEVEKKTDDAKSDDPAKKKKKRRFKAATVSKREINKAQKHGNRGFATQPTERLIREIAGELGYEGSRFEPRAIRALIEATEQFTTDYLRLADVMCAHGGRITLTKEDSHLASTLLLGGHLLQEENGSLKARLGVLKAMRRDSRSVKNDEKLVSSRDRSRAADDTDADDADAAADADEKSEEPNADDE